MAATLPARSTGSVTSELPRLPYLLVLVVEAAVAVGLFTASRDEDVLRFAAPIGWLGLGSMVVMQLYSVRRRVRSLRRLGSLRAWLDWHIFMGVQGGICITYHSARIDNWWSAPGAGLIMMWIVLGSGVFGRYLFARVPRWVSGDALTSRQLDDELRMLAVQIGGTAWEPQVIDRGTGTLAAVSSAWTVRGQLRDLAEGLVASARPANEQTRLRQLIQRRARLAARQPTMLAAERALRCWLLLHRPLVFVLATAAMLHVIAHYAFRAMP
jgi:hypothetical protein